MLPNKLQFLLLYLFGLITVLHLSRRFLLIRLSLDWITSGLKLETGFPETSAVLQGPGSLLTTNQLPAYSQFLALISFSVETMSKEHLCV